MPSPSYARRCPPNPIAPLRCEVPARLRSIVVCSFNPSFPAAIWTRHGMIDFRRAIFAPHIWSGVLVFKPPFATATLAPVATFVAIVRIIVSWSRSRSHFVTYSKALRTAQTGWKAPLRLTHARRRCSTRHTHHAPRRILWRHQVAPRPPVVNPVGEVAPDAEHKQCQHNVTDSVSHRTFLSCGSHNLCTIECLHLCAYTPCSSIARNHHTASSYEHIRNRNNSNAIASDTVSLARGRGCLSWVRSFITFYS